MRAFLFSKKLNFFVFSPHFSKAFLLQMDTSYSRVSWGQKKKAGRKIFSAKLGKKNL